MHRLHHSFPSNLIGSSLAVALIAFIGLSIPPTAHAQKINQAVSVAVVPLANLSGSASHLVGDKATDAVALALDDSQEYVVTARADTLREMTAIGIVRSESARYTISTEQMVRLGERLRVEKVCAGSVDALSLDTQGRCRCRLTVRLLDMATEEFLDGATADYTTRPIPGWKGEEADVVNEALRSAAEECVRKIQTSRTPRGNVDMVDDSGSIIVNLGARDGIQIGMELLVVRAVWNAGIEKVVLQKIGMIEVTQVSVNDSICRAVSGSVPRTADKVYVMYRPSQKVAVFNKKQQTKQYARWIAALGLGLGLYATATGDDNQSPPGVSAYLTQAAPGAEPRIRVESSGGSVPDSSQIHAWLVFRGDWAGFPATVDNRNYLISALQGAKLSMFEDDPSYTPDLTFDLEFSYIDTEGELVDDGSVDITYNHLPMTAGDSYYYKLRRIVDPGFVDIPIVDTGQVLDPEPADVDFEIDPIQSYGEPSDPAGPVTFFYPAELETPSNGSETVDPRSGRTTFRWQPTLGADQYRVMIFTNPQGTGNPVKQSAPINATSSTSTMNWVLNTDLASDTEYYWFVGAKRNGETDPLVRSSGARGWVLSEPFRFRTALIPPLLQGGAGGRMRPSDRGGIFGERRDD